MTGLSAENLFRLVDDAVRARVSEVFVAQLEWAPSVHGTFFSSAGALPVGASDPGWVDNIAVALVCSSIARSSLYGFSGTINEGAADALWRGGLADGSASAVQAGQALYAWAFPAYCQAEGHSFQEYLGSGAPAWGRQLADLVTTPAFINTEINKLIASDANWLQKLNLVFYKVHRLDDTQVKRVIESWTAALPDKHITAQWQTYNFVPPSLFAPDQYIAQVNAAINVGKSGQECLPDREGGTICSYWTDYGLAVIDFLHRRPAGLGLTTGRAPSNRRDDRGGGGGGGGCFVAGTRVALAGGQQVPIEAVGHPHVVCARDGASATHTRERVVVELQVETAVYGINEHEPFFSAGHLFWTEEGWKALAPEVALEENPHRQVGHLQVGDVLHRIRSYQPFAYERVRIERISARVLPPGRTLHGLHLEGANTYHANGFCVGMNYPVITERRLADGFATLSPAERRLVRQALEPVMPLLNKAVGRFVEQPLRRALAEPPGP